MTFNNKTFKGDPVLGGAITIGWNSQERPSNRNDEEIFISVRDGGRETYVGAIVLKRDNAISLRDHLNELLREESVEDETDPIWEGLQMDTMRDHTDALNAHAEAINRYVDLLEKQKRERDEFNRLGVV